MPPKKSEKVDRLDELIAKLDDRLELLVPSVMKEKALGILQEMHKSLVELNDIQSRLMHLFSCNYGEVVYGDDCQN
jgi:hypothetical protein